MEPVQITEVKGYVEKHIGEFHATRFKKLEELKLNKILYKKNPYLFKAKNILTAQDLVKRLLDAYLSSQEETIFGDFLEGLAIFICSKAFGGKKSAAEGIDLEFEREGIKYIVSIKSGPNWGNSGQINKMRDNFKKAKRILGAHVSLKNIVAVNGCCYGRDNKPDKGDYLKLCGRRFWEFTSGNPNLYVDIIEPLGHKAKEKNEQFMDAYSRLINKFTLAFASDFCEDGRIIWEKLVKLNSA